MITLTLQVNVTIGLDPATIILGIIAAFAAYQSYQAHGAANEVKKTAVVTAQTAGEAKVLAQETKDGVEQVHTLVNGGLTDIKEQLVTALADRDQLQIALATANERLKKPEEGAPQ